MSKIKKVSFLSTLVLTMFTFGAFAGVLSLVTESNFGLAHMVQAESGSDDEDESEDNDEEEDEEKETEKKAKEEEKAKEKMAKEKEKKAEEAAKRKVDIERQRMKIKTDILRKDSDDLFEDEQDDAEDATEKAAKEIEKAAEKAAKEAEKLDEKKADILEEIYEEIFDAAERIEKARLEGIDVTKALATLEVAKAKAKLVEQSLAVADIEAAKRIAKEVKKLAHFARNKDVHDARDIQKDVAKIAKRIAQTEGKIFLLTSLGGNASSFDAALDKAKDDFEAIKAQIAKGGSDLIASLSQLEPLERRVKSIKSSVENAIFALGGTDEDFDDELEDETEDLVDDLNDVAEIEGDEVGAEIKSVALSQKEASKRVAAKVKKADERNRVLQFLLGSDDSDMDAITKEAADNKARIQALNEAAEKIEDIEVKTILLDQVKSLEQETTKLESFVSAHVNLQPQLPSQCC